MPGDATGVPGLDDILGGGLPRGALVIVTGPPGSGKTVLAGQMAFATAQVGRHAILTTALSEPPGKLLEHLREFSFYDENQVGGAVQVLSLQQALKEGFGAIADEIITVARQANAHLVVVDGFSGVRGVDRDPQEARQFLCRLAGTLGALGMTTMVTNEANPRDPATFPEATTADVIIGLSYTLGNGRHRRGIEIIKMRGTAQLPGQHSLTLGSSGMIVYPRLESRITMDANNGRPEPGIEEEYEALPPLAVSSAPMVAGKRASPWRMGCVGAPTARRGKRLPDCSLQRFAIVTQD